MVETRYGLRDRGQHAETLVLRAAVAASTARLIAASWPLWRLSQRSARLTTIAIFRRWRVKPTRGRRALSALEVSDAVQPIL